ncbi:MAG: hypothetical protein EA397_17870 [Deltaproteobacteria bacterium]|nr:MAG: hypothetical protein EA397_17870 [Deltaproteobacteria bacterium]
MLGQARPLLDKALNYLVNQRRPLERFLEDPRVPLTNNHAKRLFRAPVQGRKAHQGSRSEGGTRILSAFYTVIGSCKLNGADPVAFMKHLVERGLAEPTSALLPSESRPRSPANGSHHRVEVEGSRSMTGDERTGIGWPGDCGTMYARGARLRAPAERIAAELAGEGEPPQG